MPYTPINWTTDTLVTPARMRHMETQHEQAVADGSPIIRSSSNEGLAAETVSAAPAGQDARIYYNTTDNKMYGYNGNEWVPIAEV